MASSNPLVYPRVGVLTGGDSPPRGVQRINGDNKKITVTLSGGSKTNFELERVTQDINTARMNFVSDGVQYAVRELREQDGLWLSPFKTDLPLEVLESIINRGDGMAVSENLYAYAIEDSPYIVAVVYTDSVGRWSRVDGTWTVVPATDNRYDSEQLEVLPIDPDKADDFLNLYDRNFVTVSDAEQYESADSEEQEDALTEDTPTQ